jgi:hypothetical protein
LLSAVPIAGAVLDAIENILQMEQMLSGPTDGLAQLAFSVSNAKWMAVYTGLILLVGAVMARLAERRQKRAKNAISTDT